MRIPKGPAERQQFYLDLIAKCSATSETRREFYKQMRSYYLFGCEDRALNQQTRYNKIYSHVETLCSFMFSPETTRFTINLGPSVNDAEQGKIPPVLERLDAMWHDSSIDQQFRQALHWSAPYGKVLLKVRPKLWKRINAHKELEEGMALQAFVVEPHNFGVLREDKGSLVQQEAFCEIFHISKSELRTALLSSGRKEEEVNSILEEVQGGSRDDVMGDASPVDRLIVTAIQGDAVTGNASIFSMPLSTMYRPTTKESLTRGTELYVYDDEIGDWRVVTYVAPDICVWDRPLSEIFIAHHLPYIEVCLNPAYDYFWGYSEVERLVPLQDLRNERMSDIVHLLRKQAHPPAAITGLSAVPDEMLLAMDTQNGILAVDSPAAAVKQLVPELPADIWHDVQVIDQMFDELSGLPASTQGKGEEGVRSKGHAAMLSALGSTRVRDRALIVEDALDECATLIVEILKRYDTRAMRVEDGAAIFQAHQFPEDFAAKVDGHSNSPIFVEHHEQKAFALLKAHVIDGEELLDLIEIPMRQALKKKLREKIAPAQQKEHQEELALKLASIRAKRAHGTPGPKPVAVPAPAA